LLDTNQSLLYIFSVVFFAVTVQTRHLIHLLCIAVTKLQLDIKTINAR